MGLNATILRPAYFMDNDVTIKDVITGHGIYPMPIGAKGLAMVDVRDIAEVAAIELIRREQAAGPLPLERINLVGPDTLTGADVAAIWSDVLGRPIAYPGEDTGRVRAEPAGVHAGLDGLRHAPDGRALRHRGHAAGSRRRRAPDRAARPPAALLPRLRRPDRGLGLTATRHRTRKDIVMIYSTATVPVNPEGETALTRAQAWEGLVLKARDARLFLPPVSAPAARSWRKARTHIVREATIAGTDLREIIAFEPGRKVTFFQATGPREGAIINELFEDEGGALQLRFYCFLGLRGKAPDGPEEQAEQAQFDSEQGLQGRPAVHAEAHPRAAGRGPDLTSARTPAPEQPRSSRAPSLLHCGG